jgi:hypothetical protein
MHSDLNGHCGGIDKCGLEFEKELPLRYRWS